MRKASQSGKWLIFFIPTLMIWVFGLMAALHLSVSQRHQRLKSEQQVVEAISFYAKSRQVRPLRVALETIRNEKGYTGLALCLKGRPLVSVGMVLHPCQKTDSPLVEGWLHPIRGMGGYTLTAETQIVTLTTTLIFILLALSFLSGVFVFVQTWREASRMRPSSPDLQLQVRS